VKANEPGIAATGARQCRWAAVSCGPVYLVQMLRGSAGLEATTAHSEMSAAFSSTVTTATMYVVVPLCSVSHPRELRTTDQTKRLTVRPSVWIRSAQKMIAVAM